MTALAHFLFFVGELLVALICGVFVFIRKSRNQKQDKPQRKTRPVWFIRFESDKGYFQIKKDDR